MTERTEPLPVTALHGLQLEVAGFSEQGPRSENQDAYRIDRLAQTGVVAVADGMGGERSGRLAADLALESLLTGPPIRSLDDARRAVRQADAQVARAAEEDPAERQGMGCALGVLALSAPRGDGAGWVGAHVGDVRILSRSPDGTIRLETRDHTPAYARWEAGEISLDEIPDTAGANRLQRAVGRGGEADVVWLPARPGWSWLLLSDGVYKVMRLDELNQIMAAPSAAAAVESIRRKVMERGPEDNFTAVLVRALGGAPAAVAAPQPAAVSHTEQTDPMIRSNPPARPQRSAGSSVAAMLLALLALLTAGFALWTAWQGRETEAERTEVQQLRAEVDSLRGVVLQLSEPFGPTAAPLPADTLTRTPVPAASGAPR